MVIRWLRSSLLKMDPESSEPDEDDSQSGSDASDPAEQKSPPDEPPDEPIRIFRVVQSLEDPVTADATRIFLNSLYESDPPPLNFGLAGVGSTAEIFPVVTGPGSYLPILRQHYQASFPHIEIIPIAPPGPNRQADFHVCYKTSNSLARITCVSDFQPDPLAIMVTAFEHLQPGELALLATTLSRFDPLIERYREYGEKLAEFNDLMADAQTGHSKGDFSEFQRKAAQPLWNARMHFQIYGPEESVKALRVAFRQYAGRFASPRARIIEAGGPTETEVMCTDELIGLVHLPHKSIESTKLVRAGKHRPPPDALTREGTLIGTFTHIHETKEVRLPNSVRDRHLYIVGKTRTGKSTLIQNLAIADLREGRGVAVIDPHGDLVEDLLEHVPQERVPDTIYFDAADREHPIALNVLQADDEEDAAVLAEDLLIAFRRLSESWGERMEHILRYTFHTLLAVDGSTFMDVANLLQNDSFRERTISRIKDRVLLEFWREQYPNLPRDAIQPILSRLSKFALSPTLRGILGQSESRLTFFDVIQNRKILLVNLGQGKVGDDTARLLGSLFVSQLQLAVMRRAKQAREERVPFYLYVDEFQNFTTSAFEKILSEAGKYQLCLTLAHQYISQLDEKMRNAILGNVGTMVAFTLWPHDAGLLRAELGEFTPEDLANLAPYEALCRPATMGRDTFKMKTLPPPPSPAKSHVEEIIAETRENYAGDGAGLESMETSHRTAVTTPDGDWRSKRPMKATEKPAMPAAERILHYVTKAQYLSTAQIQDLCYGHLPKDSRAPAASRDLKTLVTDKRIKVVRFGSANVYFVTRRCDASTHNLGIRDVFVRIERSGLELADVNFSLNLGTIVPDLSVDFLTADGALIRSLWEFDTGTEGIAEIMRKVRRYDSFPEYAPIVLVAAQKERLDHLCKGCQGTPLVGVLLDEFETLQDPMFYDLQKDGACGPLFSSL